MFFYDSYDIVIVGGGISGLFLAYKLVDTDLNILVLEKEKEFGGRIHTILKNGYQYECGAARFSNKHNKDRKIPAEAPVVIATFSKEISVS